MADLPDRKTLAAALAQADVVHEEYERTALKGMGDDKWPGFVAAFVIGKLGEFVPASRLALLVEEVAEGDDWANAAADHVLMKLRS
ncbi:MAG TPA: hypothetical protein VHA70_16085 [Bauldia sp.]|nr:hypothetical protein [Bauldia sp.]